MSQEFPDPEEHYAVDARRPLFKSESSKFVAIVVAGLLVVGGGTTATVIAVQNSQEAAAERELAADGKILTIPKNLQKELGWMRGIMVDPIAVQTDSSYYDIWKEKLGIRTETISIETAKLWDNYSNGRTPAGDLTPEQAANFAANQNKNLTAYVNAIAANRNSLTPSQLTRMKREIAYHFVEQATYEHANGWDSFASRTLTLPILDKFAADLKPGEVANVYLSSVSDIHGDNDKGASITADVYSQKSGDRVDSFWVQTNRNIADDQYAGSHRKAFPPTTPEDARAFFYG